MTEPASPAALLDRDGLARLLGIDLVEAGAGHATVRLRIEARHLNFNGTCHGGVTFALADTAFGLASNSHGTLAAAIGAHVTFPRAGREGDLLVAAARELSRTRRIATYGVEVTRGDGRLIATFTGTVAIIEGGRPGAVTLAP